MQITGNELREALKIWNLRREAAQREFESSLNVFEGEVKKSPVILAEEFVRTLLVHCLEEPPLDGMMRSPS